MADYTQFKISVGESGSTYPAKYTGFVNASEARAEEVEDAREFSTSGATNLEDNLANYMKYTIVTNVSGGNSFKCINMKNGDSDSQDYCTVGQAESLLNSGGSQAQSIEDLAVGTLSANDILVVNTLGGAITGRSTVYSTLISPCVANGNYDMGLSTGDKNTTLPAGVLGTVISFADIGGYAGLGDPPVKLTITPASGERIMGQTTTMPTGNLIVDDYPSCSFDLVYVNSTFGWTMARLQR
jgi:hypothetical protein